MVPSGLEGSVYGQRHWLTFSPDGFIVFKLIGSLALFYAPFAREVLHTENGSHLFVLPFMHLQAATKFYNEGDSSPSVRAHLFTDPVKTVIEYFSTLQRCDTPQFNLTILPHKEMLSMILKRLSVILSTLPTEWSKYRLTVNFMLSWMDATVDRATGLFNVKFERHTFTEEIESSDPLRRAFEQLTFARKMGCLSITCPSADETIHSWLCSTVPFRSIWLSRAAHLGGLAEIETVSRVTGCFGAIFRVCEGSGSPRCERRAPYKAGGRMQNFVHLVTSHTPGRIERNGTVLIEG